MGRRGLSLFEVLVSVALFSVMMLALFAVYFQAATAHRKGSAQSEAYRSVMLALNHTERELRGAQLLFPTTWGLYQPPSTELTYFYPQVQDGQVTVDTTGTPLWAGRARLSVAGGRYLQHDETRNTERLLADLGPTGTVSFKRVERDLLEVKALAYKPDELGRSVTRFEFAVVLRLENQP